MANPRVITNPPGRPPQPDYRPTEAEIIAKIKAIEADIALLKKKLGKLQTWAAKCKSLRQFNEGNLLSRITSADYNNLSDAALRERYLWLAQKDIDYINQKNPAGVFVNGTFVNNFSPDFSVHVLKPGETDGQFGPLPAMFPWLMPSGTLLRLISFTYLQSVIDAFNAAIKSKQADLSIEREYYTRLFKKPAPGTKKPKPKATGPGTTTPSTPPVVTTWKDIRNQPTKYNVPSVKESYFQNGLFTMVKDGDRAGRTLAEQVPLFEGNKPQKVIDASQLWESAKGSKGMIQISTQVPSSQNYNVTNPDANTVNPFDISNVKYGFQFLYNPTTIEMQYMGIAQTDMTMYTSGTEAFNLIPPTTTSATITFDILLNRMNDMKYYTPQGKLTANGKNAYPADHVPDATEQKQIYNMGTMYDVEYLLRTLLGYTSKSYLRNGLVTADLGWFSKKPVELHLGKNLRYLGFVGGVSLRHVVFSENMVPLFTTMHIEFSRIPDYPYVDDKSTAKDK
jgi:hypothetical protein